MASQQARPPPPANGEPAADELPVGPPSGLASTTTIYMSEQTIRQMMKSVGNDQSREDTYRLKGVQLIDNVRESLQLPVRTFDTAAIYYHKFRCRYRSTEYELDDVALACLFVACKTEDTIKKSKEILCAAHNLTHPIKDHKTPDDKSFDKASGITIGLERHILETIGFDFRAQYPQKILVKTIKRLSGPPLNIERDSSFLRTAYDMSIDIFRTFAPLKQTSSTLMLAILELTTLFMNHNPNKVKKLLDEAKFHTDRASEYETMMDLMDLYTQFGKLTKVGPNFDLARLMDIKINISKRMAEDGYQRYVGFCEKCMESPEIHPVTPGSAKSPATNNSLSGSGSVRGKPGANDRTVRYVFDAEEARKEKALVAEYHEDEYEEYEVEVEEPVPPEPAPRPPPLQNGRGAFSHRGQGHHPGHGYGGYSRGGHMPYSDRSRGRGGYRGYH